MSIMQDNISQLKVENDDDVNVGRHDDIDVSNDDIDISNLSIVDNNNFDSELCKNDKKKTNIWLQMIVEINDDKNNIINIQKDGDILIDIIEEDETKIDLIDKFILTKESLNTKPSSYLQEFESTFKNDDISIEGYHLFFKYIIYN